MTDSSTSTLSAHEIERLLASLQGVRSARVLLGDGARIEEIHVLCSPALQTKQVVRNIESALSAGLGIHVDRRIISVAQLREEIADIATPAPAAPHTRIARHDATAAQPAAPTPAAARPERRFAFVAFDARTQAGTSVCRVSVRRGRRELEGVGSGPNTLQGRACAAAEALFDAVGKAEDVGRIGLDGAAIVELSGKPFVLVAAHGTGGRAGVQLTGVAALARSPEETAILAALQAANRWAEPR